jgi:hypothetical protein
MRIVIMNNRRKIAAKNEITADNILSLIAKKTYLTLSPT